MVDHDGAPTAGLLADAVPPTTGAVADPIADAGVPAVTAALDAALAHSQHVHQREGRQSLAGDAVPQPRFTATRDVAGAAASPGAHGLSVSGVLDAATAPLLTAMFAEPDLDHSPGFVIDLRDLTFIDPAGIEVLRGIHAALTRSGQYAQVTPAVSPAVQQLLRTAVADGFLPAAFTFTSPYVGAARQPRQTPVSGDVRDAIPELDVAVRYVPASVGDNEPTAGDFFDVLLLPTGAVALALGDVSGHGPRAAARRRTLRAAVRAFALIDPSPSHVLSSLERASWLTEPDDVATVWYALYTPGSGQFTYAAAGHPPPVHWASGSAGVTLLQGATTPPLGAGFGQPPAVTHRSSLLPGDVLVVYSDGLIERPDRDFDTQLGRLVTATHLLVRPGRPSLESGAIADGLIDTFVASSADLRDDVCVAVIRRREQ